MRDFDITPPTNHGAKMQINVDHETPSQTNSPMDVSLVTPLTKNGGKRNVSEIEGINLNNTAFSPDSVNKMPKMSLRRRLRSKDYNNIVPNCGQL